MSQVWSRSGNVALLALICTNSAVAFDVMLVRWRHHQGITFEALRFDGSTRLQIEDPLSVATKVITPPLHFRMDALEKIAEANVDSDRPQVYCPWDHFDDPDTQLPERCQVPGYDGKKVFRKPAKKIESLRQQIIELARKGDQTGAWDAMGRTLHTIQDFYAHSSWSHINTNPETTATHIDSQLGVSGFYENIGYNHARFADAGCSDGDAVLNDLAVNSRLVTTAVHRQEHENPKPPYVNNLGVLKCVHGRGGTGPFFRKTNWEGSGFDKDVPRDMPIGQRAVVQRAVTQSMWASRNFAQSIVDELEASGTPEDFAAVCLLLGQPLTLCERTEMVRIYKMNPFLTQKVVTRIASNKFSSSGFPSSTQILDGQYNFLPIFDWGVFNNRPGIDEMFNSEGVVVDHDESFVCSIGVGFADAQEWIPKKRSSTITEHAGPYEHPFCQQLPEEQIKVYRIDWQVGTDGIFEVKRAGMDSTYRTCSRPADDYTGTITTSYRDYGKYVTEFSVNARTQEMSILHQFDARQLSDKEAYIQGLPYQTWWELHEATSTEIGGVEPEPLPKAEWLKPVRSVVYEGPNQLPAECRDEIVNYDRIFGGVSPPPLP